LSSASRDVVDGSEEFEVSVTVESPEETAFTHTEQSAQGSSHIHLVVIDVEAVHDSSSRIRREKGAENFDEGCFSRAVWSE